MTKEKILDYVTETPGNTNRNVLGSMLDNFAKSGGSSGITVFNEITEQDPEDPERIFVRLDASFNDVLNAGYCVLKADNSFDENVDIQYRRLYSIVTDENEERPYIVTFDNLSYDADDPTKPLYNIK